MSENRSYGPKRLDKIHRALEAAWAEVESEVPDALRDGTRQEMAVAAMNTAKAGQTKFKELKAAAIAAARPKER